MKFTTARKAKRVFKLLTAFTLIIVCFTSCGLNDYYYLNNNISLEHGFKQSGTGCDDQPIFYGAYKSDKRVFEIDDVTLDFYYGGRYLNLAAILEGSHNIPSFKIYLANGDAKHLVKCVEENLVSEKYNCEAIRENGYIKEIIFNHSESIKIPKELFMNESGSIDFMIYGTDILDTDPIEKGIIRTSFFYKIINEKVVLSDRTF